MPDRPGFMTYIGRAFSARPIGMLVPPNWVGLAAVGMLGLINPGFWLVGAGLEVGYLVWLAHNPRFRAVIDGEALGAAERERRATADQQLARLSRPNLMRYQALSGRCREILDQQSAGAGSGGLDSQADGLNRLVWIYLRLLLTLETIARIDDDRDGERERLDDRVKDLTKQLAATDIAEDLRKSLSSQLDIVQQRLAKRKEASDKKAFVAAEIQRIEEQVELIREQAMLASDPQAVSQRIDEVAGTLGGTNDWIRDQQRLYGQVEDLVSAPPALLPPRQAQGGHA
jgi:hypothetical protein